MITIYGKPSDVCIFCKKVKELADNEGISYTFIDISNDDVLKAKVRADGFSTVPAIYDGDLIIGGFKEFEKNVYKMKNNLDI